MKKGMYVRCPIVREEADEVYPRLFVMAQVTAVDDFTEELQVEIHDLHNCKRFYPHAFEQKTFYSKDLNRCKAPVGYTVKTKSGWGRILAVLPNEDESVYFYKYYIELDGSTCQLFSEEDIHIDFNQMDYSPLKQLKEYEFQNPSWYASRFVVSNTNHVLNNAVYGFRTLAGCRVFLLPHQVVTIIRCLETRPVRYMLADEVGLGKTIEACGIVKILETQNSYLRVLYTVPFSLMDQWKNELFYKFNIDASVYNGQEDDCRHMILPMSELTNHPELYDKPGRWDVVVVDETHRLLSDEKSYEIVKKLSKGTNNFLILSATPIQDRRQEYLNLLTLLSPDQYGDMQLEEFGLIVEKQKKIQRRIHSIVDDVQKYDDYADSILNRLMQLAEDLYDDMLKQIVSTIDLDCEDKSIETVQQVIAYICEHYRLERRVVRNRRDMLRDRMPPRRLEIVSYAAGTAHQLYDEAGATEVVLNWIQENKTEGQDYIINTAQPVISALFSSPWALKKKLQEKGMTEHDLVMLAVNDWVSAAEEEIKQIDFALDEEPDLIRGRLLKALDYIDQETDISSSDKTFKILVFTQFTSTLEKFHSMVAQRYGEDACTVFCAGLDRETLESNADYFQRDDECRIMICDELGGEGRNFQNADIVIHLDIPWTANALEQRIGRLDRLGRDQERDVVSVVLFAENTIEEQLFKLWNEGMQIFTQSLSGLEIITGEVNSRIAEALQDDIWSGLTYALDDIIEHTLDMRDGVEDEQMYDTEAMLYRPLTKVIELMLNTYQGQEDKIFASSMLSWSSQAGLRSNKENGNKMLIEFQERNFSVASSNNAMLIPPDWSKYQRYPLVKRSGKILGTFNRSLAIQREDILFYAPGDPIFDAVVKNALTCSRGRSSVFMVKSPSLEFYGFLLVWNIEPDIKQILKEGISIQYLSQFRAYLPIEQLLTIYPLNENSKNISTDELKNFILKERNSIKQSFHWGGRKGYEVNRSNIQEFVEKNPADKWVSIINKVYNACYEKAKEELHEFTDYESASVEINRIVQAYCASNLFFGRDELENEEIKNIYGTVLHALKNPELSLDSIALIKVVKTSG